MQQIKNWESVCGGQDPVAMLREILQKGNQQAANCWQKIQTFNREIMTYDKYKKALSEIPVQPQADYVKMLGSQEDQVLRAIQALHKTLTEQHQKFVQHQNQLEQRIVQCQEAYRYLQYIK